MLEQVVVPAMENFVACSMPQNIYCIPGLAADHRLFERLNLPGYTLVPVDWRMPHAQETLPHFAARLAEQIPERHPIVLGVSFGGMLATEISKLTDCTALVVSTCKTRQELPAYLRMAGRMHLHKSISFTLAKNAALVDRIFFDKGTEAEEIKLKRAMLRDSPNALLHRSVHMILQWQNSQWKPDVFHVHGTRDRLLTPGRVQANAWIEDGTHFMIWNRADAVAEKLLGFLQKQKALPESFSGNA